MRLILGVVGESAEASAHNAAKAFGPEGGSLGRGRSCQWQLPDPTNTLSARHALIAFNGIGFTITDTSTNGIYINTVDAPLGRGNTAPLADGDTLYMASYIISVAIENNPVEERERLDSTGSTAVRIGRAVSASALPPFAQESPDVALTAIGPSGNDGNIQLDPLEATGTRKSSSSSAAQDEPQDVVSPQSAHPLRLPGAKAISEDAGSVEPNLLADPSLSAHYSSAASTEMPSSLDVLHRPPSALANGSGGPLSSHGPPIIPDDLDLSDLLPGPALHETPPPPRQAASPPLNSPKPTIKVARKPLDPAAANDLGALRAPSPSAPRPREREVDLLVVLKELAARRPVSAPEGGNAITAPRSPAASPPDVGELQEFWKALEVDPGLVPPAGRREVFVELGRALAEMVNGLHSILASWAVVRKEFCIEPMQMGAANNNAFMNSGHGALREALANDQGFQPLSLSVREGFRDIKAHHVAATTAIRAAVSNVLTQMSPQRIESDGTNSGVFGARINKAKLWDRFVELHASMANDIDRTAHTYIAEEFRRSYELQLGVVGRSQGNMS